MLLLSKSLFRAVTVCVNEFMLLNITMSPLVTVSGDGNLRALSLPRLPDVPGARAFQPSSKEKAEERKGRLFGTRTVETVLVPDRARLQGIEAQASASALAALNSALDRLRTR